MIKLEHLVSCGFSGSRTSVLLLGVSRKPDGPQNNEPKLSHQAEKFWISFWAGHWIRSAYENKNSVDTAQ